MDKAQRIAISKVSVKLLEYPRTLWGILMGSSYEMLFYREPIVDFKEWNGTEFVKFKKYEGYTIFGEYGNRFLNSENRYDCRSDLVPAFEKLYEIHIESDNHYGDK